MERTMPSRRQSSRVLAIVAMLLLALAALPAATAAGPGNGDAAQRCKQGGWQALAPAEEPSVAFASQGDCVSYVAWGGAPVDLEVAAAAPVETEAPGNSEDAPGHDPDGPGNSENAPGHDDAAEPGDDVPASDGAEACRQGAWADLAPVETPTIRFESEGDCVSYAVQGGAIVPVQAVAEPTDADDGPGNSDAAQQCRQGDWADLAPIETPLDAFDSQADCIRYAADGGEIVDAIPSGLGGARDDCAAAQAYIPGSGTSLAGLHLYECDLSGHDLRDANLMGAILIDANLASAILAGSILQDADLRYADLTGADLSGADLGHANLSGATLTSVTWTGVSIWSARLRGANLAGADLSNLPGVGLWRSDLSGANLTNANLSGDNLQETDLSGANLTNANLSGVDLSDANMVAANLSGANLTNADLARANLIYAILTGATVDGANFFLATCPDGTQANFEFDPDTGHVGGSCDGHLDWQ
jgi:uncharacterized protein YjbI with pentapeptide repeats